jgi:short-subunit dehydrogenase
VNFAGQRVLITGGSSGIGRAIADAVAGRGGILCLAARTPDHLQKACNEIARRYPNTPRPLACPCDVTDRTAVRRLVAECRERLGGIDVLFNNAGISVYGPVERTGAGDFAAVMAVNFQGAVNCTLEVLPVMRRQGSGHIVNVGSVAALHGTPFLGAYSASKAALTALTESLRAETAGSGIAVTIVHPDYTESGIFAAEKNVGGARRPSGPYASTAKVAEAIVRAVENGKREFAVSARGRALGVARAFAPGIVERRMERLAKELRTREGENG